MAFQIEYNDPTVIFEKFLTTVRGLWPKATDKIGSIDGEWNGDTYTISTQFGLCLDLKLISYVEYAYITLAINNYNRDIPVRLY